MSVNKVIIIGRLGKDPELKYTQNQVPVVNVTVATSEGYKDQSGQWQERTEWHTIVVFNKTAENVSKYLKKGSQVYAEGSLRTRKWQDKEGKDRYTTEIVANTVQFLDSKGKTGDAPQQDEGYTSAPVKAAFNLQSADEMSGGKSGNNSDFGNVNFSDDDLPF